MDSPAPDLLAHTWIDDGHALIAGSLFVALGLTMFAHAGLLTGGVAGLAFLASYASGFGLGLCFFAFSLPFFWLSWVRLGREFTLKSFCAVALVSACTTLAPRVVRFELLNPWVAAVLGGFLIGFGLLALLRHRASVGGVNILAQWLQQSRGLSAGKVQMSVDVVVVLAAFFVVPPVRVLQSVVGAVAIGAILTLNHRPGRYLGV
ncbi:MAG: YitT family protein [Piscinibacter sp.]|nr:YitT family protein [Piscinibacter sp.]